MKSLRSCSLVLLVMPFLAGCGGTTEADDDPARDAVGDSGILHFQADAEKPLSQGANDLLISIHEESTHAPFMGAVVDLSAIMPAMAHATPLPATIEEIDGGTYVARGLALPMAGRWYVDVKASRADALDTVRFTYDIR
jgi:hypothetical protein